MLGDSEHGTRTTRIWLWLTTILAAQFGRGIRRTDRDQAGHKHDSG
jgi:hypothetical protein